MNSKLPTKKSQLELLREELIVTRSSLTNERLQSRLLQMDLLLSEINPSVKSEKFAFTDLDGQSDSWQFSLNISVARKTAFPGLPGHDIGQIFGMGSGRDSLRFAFASRSSRRSIGSTTVRISTATNAASTTGPKTRGLRRF